MRALLPELSNSSDGEGEPPPAASPPLWPLDNGAAVCYNLHEMKICLRLKMPRVNKERALLEYMDSFSECVSWYLEKCKEASTSSRTKLDRLYYREAREKFPQLLARSLGCARDKAIEAFRSFRRQKGEKSFPHPRKMACFPAETYCITDKAIVIHLRGRVLNLPYHVAPRYKDMLKLKHGRAELVKANGHWYFHVPVELPKPEEIKPEGVMGIDLGLAKIATTSTGVFFRGEQARFIRDHHAKKRAELQKKMATKTSKNAYKVLKRLSGKEARWMRDLNHKISRAIVNEAVEKKTAIAMENLAGIRSRLKATKKVRRMLNSWSFRQLAGFIEYKSQLAGIKCVTVDPRQTSITCPKCGLIDKRNRKSQSEFKCKRCGYQANADFVAATNIAQLGSLLLGYMPKGKGSLGTAPIWA